MKNQINRNTRITGEILSQAVSFTVCDVLRDIEKACSPTKIEGTTIVLHRIDLPAETFKLQLENEGLCLYASEEMGFIYGLYHISRSILGIQDFWFWNDQIIVERDGYPLDNVNYQSRPYAVRLRGWFINDEVLLSAWELDHSRELPWQMAFETLLRCGGNMVIPGTGRNARRYRELAARRGLAITHHHAEPLGAEMFVRAYPDKEASYDKYPELFQRLWSTAVEEQSGMKVIWNLGFRGQGDYPFWENNPDYNTPESRGALMSRLIDFQYRTVKEQNPDAVFCSNLYGETMELYRQGFLSFPKGTIKIWADNGFGKMVTRRQENHDPRLPSLPTENDDGPHGLYYHVSFYDLQAASHITMLPSSPELVKSELKAALGRGVRDYWLINCSNIKPHTYYLDFIAELWRNGNIDIGEHRVKYARQYYGESAVPLVSDALRMYFETSAPYGSEEDQKAGEQFFNHVPRILVSSYMKDDSVPAVEMLWACKEEKLEKQIRWYYDTCSAALAGYRDFCKKCGEISLALEEDDRRLFKDSLMLQGVIRKECAQGATLVCASLQHALFHDYQKSFFIAGKARECYLRADKAMRDREHGKWHGFYKNECLTDIKQTAWVLRGLMSYLRNLGDGPHFYRWQRDFLYSREDARVMLLMNMENHLEDLELFELMEAQWDDSVEDMMKKELTGDDVVQC